MTDDMMKRFDEELADSGDDIELWKMRKNMENESFWGMEIDPAKQERLEKLQARCILLAKRDHAIRYMPEELTPQNRNGTVRLSLPPVLFSFDKRVSSDLAALFKLADDFCISAPRLVSEDEEDEFLGTRDGKEILLTFGVHDMWKTYGKAPFI